MRVSVIGAGYVGLVSAACYAETGNDVLCMDNDSAKIARLKRGEIPIYEPQLEELVRNNIKEDRLRFTDQIKETVDHGLILFVAVNTPQDHDGSADLKYVTKVAEEIGESIEKYRIVVVKSTVPVGTCEKVRDVIRTTMAKRGKDISFDIASNPEFLKEGMAVEDCMRPERVVIGVENTRVEEILAELYAPFTRTGAPFLVMDLRSSEMTKYAANAMLATRISFMNQIANVCERVGADAMKVMRGIGSDSRIGPKFLFPGIGFGGSCFPKDVRALIRTSSDCGYDFSILKEVIDVNQAQKEAFLGKILSFYDGDVKGRKFAVWGLSFKPNTDDMREAPAVDIVNGLAERGALCAVYDPKAMEAAASIFDSRHQIVYGKHQYDVLDGADALLLLTEWLSFREPDFGRMKGLMKAAVIFDGRNQYKPSIVAGQGFRYMCVGRSNV